MRILLCLLLLSATLAYGQPPSETLTARYGQMKSKAQTFKDYKVIKETTLDAFWTAVTDSLVQQQQKITQVNAEVEVLKNQIVQVEANAKRREAEVEEIVFDSDHITVAGIPFHKAFFLSIVFIAIASLVALLTLSFTRSQLLYRSLKEKSESMLVLNSEFEEYKHRAVEKQMKLSRELQNERNKVSELSSHR